MSQLPPFIDLHNHLVPGVDDGAATVAESLDALRGLYRQGVRVLVATPHLLLPRLSTEAAVTRELDLQRRAFHRLADAVARETDLPMIGLGQEIWAPDAASILRVVHRNDLGLDGSRPWQARGRMDTKVTLRPRQSGIEPPDRLPVVEAT